MTLGYDARLISADLVKRWPSNRRLAFLLSPKITVPLSVDNEVWPSIFESASKFHRPAWTGAVHNLWEDFDSLTDFLSDVSADSEQPFLAMISITLIEKYCSSEQLREWRNGIERVKPCGSPSTAHILGYDVADNYLCSSLTNIGYSDGDGQQKLKDTFAKHLNCFHLFEDPEMASTFADASNKRVPEHAPFFVFALCLLALQGGREEDTHKKRGGSHLISHKCGMA